MASRGAKLERAVNKANIRYKKEKKALIMKVAVPIIHTRKGMVATTSTVDFAGVLKGGRYIAYDCKETKSKTSFPIKNLHQHQLTYLQYVRDLNGIAFLLVHFTAVHSERAYLVPIEKIEEYWQVEGMRKSIPLKEFENSWLVDIDNYLINYIEPEEK